MASITRRNLLQGVLATIALACVPKVVVAACSVSAVPNKFRPHLTELPPPTYEELFLTTYSLNKLEQANAFKRAVALNLQRTVNNAVTTDWYLVSKPQAGYPKLWIET